MKDGLISKFLKFSYGSWVGLILGLLTTMITTRILPADAFGKFSMFDLFLQIGMILASFGTDQAFIRFFYEEVPEKRGALLYRSLIPPFINMLIMTVFMIVFYDPISTFVIGHSSFGFIIIMMTGVAAQVLFRYGQLVIRMQQKGNLFSLLQIFQKVFYLALIIIIFYLIGSTYNVLVISRVITLILLAAIAVFLGRNFWHLGNIAVRNVKHSQSDIMRYGTPFIFTIFISWLFESFDKIALRQWADFDELGLYTAAMKLVAMLMVLKQTFSTFWSPVAYEKFETEPHDRDFFRYMAILVSFLMFIVAIISIAGKDILVILLGSEYHPAACIMPFLVFMPVFYTISQTTVMGINFYKKTKWHLPISIIACAANIIGNWLLVPHYGAIGASLATALSFIVFFILRTQVSLMFFKVRYPLARIYIMMLIITIYAIGSIVVFSVWLNILLGIIPLLILILLFYRDLIYIIKNRGTILN